ncbi:alkaline phosphatase family protein [Halorussus lipolyticus]|uniref:alkaline phosphatase family protein n=1 Tax=Halorussus lipolyticus TaxID=3034024 RepID=UPI0023E8A05F|nr:nucleotide pyrophosphatase/phosphodiesterase family protein [Halorussus sp. DT80]
MTAERVVVLNVVGFRPEYLGSGHAPNLTDLLGESAADLRPPFPAVTIPVQTTLATGQSPATHGDVANGEYDRESDSVAFWERDRGDRERIWETARDAGLTTGALFFQHLIGTNADVAVTPSPIEDENNDLIEMNCWTNPDDFYDELEAEHGHFPLHHYWGPGANEESSEWILTAARESVERYDPDLLWVYVPHLDYDAQRHGPDSAELMDAVETVDAMVGGFLDHLRNDDRWDETVVGVVSEYGFHGVETPVFPNRALREAGLLEAHEEDTEAENSEAEDSEDGEGGIDVDIPASDAFAMVDHQAAHVYTDQEAIPEAREVLAGLDGVAEVLGEEGKAEYGIDHEDSGELVLVADPDAWFQYYWWADDETPPSYATEMDIHAKPGFDPCELFFGEKVPVSLSPSQISGSHGRVDDDVGGICAFGGPAAPDELPSEVDARQVAPTIAGLLGVEDDLGMDFEGSSVVE